MTIGTLRGELVPVVLTTLLLISAPNARAILIDEAGDTGMLTDTVGTNDALLLGVNGNGLQGVGASKVFLTVNQSGGGTTEAGYNTEGAVEFQTVASGTESLMLSDIPLVDIGSTNYYEFAFALNQTGGSDQISINQIQLFQANAGNLTGYDFGVSATEIFNWQSNGQTLTVEDFEPGLSKAEMLMFVPAAAFGTDDFVMLYMNAGVPAAANDGLDKWIAFGNAACQELNTIDCEPVPPTGISEPTSLALLGLGLLGLRASRRIHRQS